MIFSVEIIELPVQEAPCHTEQECVSDLNGNAIPLSLVVDTYRFASLQECPFLSKALFGGKIRGYGLVPMAATFSSKSNTLTIKKDPSPVDVFVKRSLREKADIIYRRFLATVTSSLVRKRFFINVRVIDVDRLLTRDEIDRCTFY